MTQAELQIARRHYMSNADVRSPLARSTLREIYSSRGIYVGRLMISISQLTVYLFTPIQDLFAEVVGEPAGPRCEYAGKASIYCLPLFRDHVQSTAIVCIFVIVAAASGWRPRVTSPFHAWVSLSAAVSFKLPDGGESIAAVVTLVVLPLMLADSRVWQWRGAFAPTSGASRAWAVVTIWALRVQLAGIYLHAGVSKGGVGEWVDGSAMYYIVRDPYFGAGGVLSRQILWLTDQAWGTYLLSWSGILVEIAIAVLLFPSAASRKWSVRLDIAFHSGIILAIGLWSFSLVMMGSVILAATLPGRNPARDGVDSINDEEKTVEVTG